MPYKNKRKARRTRRPFKRNRRVYKRRGYGRRRRSTLKITKTVVRGPPTGVNDCTWLKLKYIKKITVVGDVTLGTGFFILRGNGPFDPEEAAGGSQPIGFDKWGLLYNRIFCAGSKISCRITNLDTTTTVTALIIPDKSAFIIEDFTDWEWMALPGNKFTTLGPNRSSRDTTILKHYMTSAKMYAHRGMEEESTFASTFGALPENQWRWNVGFIRNDTVEAATNVNVVCTVTYYCKCFDRKDLTDA